MCGIAGWVAYRRDLSAEREAAEVAEIAEAMTQTMACRGPDDTGLWLGTHAALGHRRLAVIDLPGGRQPMTAQTADGSVTLVYSGECYNYTELRAELRGRGHEFRTDSDTEVVLRGYLEWGEELPGRLNGMYAFAIWDDRDSHLLLVRDRMGVKPLYYYPTSDGVLFGSEPKAILANPLASREVGLDGLRELFAFIKTPGTAIWDGMREVRPGTVVSVDRAGHRSRTYWALTATEHTDSIPDTTARVRELLDDIVARQLISDVPLCMLLSGGIDSSALTALAARQQGERGPAALRSFAVDFVGQVDNFVGDDLRTTPDGPFVHDVAEHTGIDHHDIVLNPSTLADPAARLAVMTARDMPMGQGEMDNSLYLLFTAIRQHSTVALSGESADEVFGGYPWFHEPVVQQADAFPWLVSPKRQGFTRALMLSPDAEKLLDLPGYAADRYREAAAEVPVLDGESGLELRMRRICYLHLTRWVRILLDRKDRMSMAVGLEVRVPYCDHRLVEYVFNTPWAYKTYDGREKSLLRGAVADVLPRSVLERPKSIYPVTQDLGYVAELQRQAAAALRSGNGDLELFDVPRLTKITAMDPKAVAPHERLGMEKVLDFSVWLNACRVRLRLN